MESKQHQIDCIEVSAVAKILGVSTTTVYNKLNGEWAEYKRKNGSLTMVDLAALTEEQRETALEILSKRAGEVSNPDENDLKRFETALKEQIEILKSENARLERLLDDANKRIGEKDAAITALTERALTAIEQAHFLTAQAQAQAAALPEPDPEEEPDVKRWFGFGRKKKK